MRDDRFEVSVTFDERRGYVATAPELRQPVAALSHAARRPTRCSAAIPASCTRSGGWPRPRSDESVPARSEHGARVASRRCRTAGRRGGPGVLAPGGAS
jgi:hypothetical protein